MSRIGKRPVAIPSGVTANIDGKTLSVKGPKGTLTMGLSDLIEHGPDFAEELGHELRPHALHAGVAGGQLAHVLRAEFLVDAISFHKVQGRPFQITEIEHRIRALLRKSRPKAEAVD